jgi:hypothetical protein
MERSSTNNTPQASARSGMHQWSSMPERKMVTFSPVVYVREIAPRESTPTSVMHVSFSGKKNVSITTKDLSSTEQIKMANEEVWSSTKKLETLLEDTFIAMDAKFHGAYEQELEKVDLRLSDKWYELRVSYCMSKNPELDACDARQLLWKEDDARAVCE